MMNKLRALGILDRRKKRRHAGIDEMEQEAAAVAEKLSEFIELYRNGDLRPYDMRYAKLKEEVDNGCDTGDIQPDSDLCAD